MLPHLAALISILVLSFPLFSAYPTRADRVPYSAQDDASALSSSAVAISAGSRHTCAVTVEGGVRCWGDNAYGQLGDGTTVDRREPVDVLGLGPGSNVISVSAGDSHTCALLADGGVKCWGYNKYGQLGDGSWTQQLTPVAVIGLGAGRKAAAISAGGWHTCALTASGGVMCWGENSDGQLGNGTTQSRAEPVNVIGLAGGVAEITAGKIHSCALAVAGGVTCWGRASEYGAEIHRIPADVTGWGADSSVTHVVGGPYDTCAIVAGGVQCTRDWSLAPEAVNGLGPGSGVFSLAAGKDHTCAVAAGAVTKCWGDNLYGQVGDGTRINRPDPVDVIGLDPASAVTAVVAGEQHSCALQGGGIMCWGNNQQGQLGNGLVFEHWTPVQVAGLPAGSEILAVTAGHAYTCALSDGGVLCWGWNMGTGMLTRDFQPAYVMGLGPGSDVTAVAAGTVHTCAIVAGGVKCWGYNQFGQLGDDTKLDRSAPADVVGLRPGSNVILISAGNEHTCAARGDGQVLCWGRNANGQLGDGTTADRWAPVGVTGLGPGSGAIALSAGNRHTCAVTAVGARCWGYNYFGQLGDGSMTPHLTPVAVSGLDARSGVTAISAGNIHTCAQVAGGAKCWGDNYYGQLGDGTDHDRVIPVDVAGLGASSSVTHIGAAEYHSCAVVAGGVKCWGYNYGGRLGDGTNVDRFTPVDVVGLDAGSGATDMAVGDNHSCAVVTGELWCWGSNYFGQLGINPGWVPTPVIGFRPSAAHRLFQPQIGR